MTHVYNEPEVVTLLHRVLDEVGRDYRYPINEPCRYFSGTSGDSQAGPARCIVGQVLALAGYHSVPRYAGDLPLRALTEPGWSAGMPALDGEWREKATSWWREKFSHPALVLLSRVQLYQDEHMPWGEAVELGLADLTAMRERGEL